MILITDERCTGYGDREHPERPERITASIELLRRQKELQLEWRQPEPAPEKIILLAHTAQHIANVRSATEDFCPDTPAHPGIFEHALRAAGGALAAMNCARQGRKAFSLMRPPGHHATGGRAMGFCYFNNIAIAAMAARDAGVGRVAVYDFDVHHGNGTEEILLDKAGFAFVSIHQSPLYPGTGRAHRGSNCFNYPVQPRASRDVYKEALQRGLESVLKFKPELVAVSAGFDAYARDPLAQSRLEAEDFMWIGRQLGGLGVPCFSVLEGGYSGDLPQLILAFLKGWEG